MPFLAVRALVLHEAISHRSSTVAVIQLLPSIHAGAFIGVHGLVTGDSLRAAVEGIGQGV